MLAGFFIGLGVAFVALVFAGGMYKEGKKDARIAIQQEINTYNSFVLHGFQYKVQKVGPVAGYKEAK